MLRKVLLAATLTLAVICMPGPALAGAPTDTVKTTIDDVIKILQNPSLKSEAKTEERRKLIRTAVDKVFDFKEMAMRSLARNWAKRTPQEKKEFTGLFSDLLERSYINRVESYSDEKVSYDSEEIDGDYAVVKTRFITKRREEISVDYKMMNEDGAWKVYDVVIERVSLVNNYRIQFNKIIASSSYDELVKKMKNKAESEMLAAPGNG
jgi:phospholipid transport system substrate-binding protein